MVVPVYNEGKNIGRWWTEARAFLPPESVVRVIYDFDEDDTLPVVRSLIAAGAPMEALKNQSRGVLAALITGLRSVESGPVLVSMADLSDDFGSLPAMLAAYAAGAKVVVCSRYMPGGRQEGGPRLKAALSRVAGVTLHRLAGFPTHDATNSFRLYDAGFLRRIQFDSRGGFEIGFEITLKAWMAGEPVVEVPGTWRGRVEGESRFDLRKWLPLYGRLWLRGLWFGLTGR